MRISFSQSINYTLNRNKPLSLDVEIPYHICTCALWLDSQCAYLSKPSMRLFLPSESFFDVAFFGVGIIHRLQTYYDTYTTVHREYQSFIAPTKYYTDCQSEHCHRVGQSYYQSQPSTSSPHREIGHQLPTHPTGHSQPHR